MADIVKGEPHELTEMEVQFVSLVPQGANRQTKWLVRKTGQTIKMVPSADDAPEKKKEMQEARSKRYGIEIRDTGSSLSYPAGYPTTESMYGDPVNLAYPWGDENNAVDLGRLRNALARFKQNYSEYKQDASKKVVWERIVRMALSQGIDVSYDPQNPVDSLLSQDLKDRLSTSSEEEEKSMAAQKDDKDGQPEPTTADMSWLDTADQSLSDMMFDAILAAQPDDTAVGKQDVAVPEKAFHDVEYERLQKENGEQRRALEDLQEALRQSEIHAAKVVKMAVGAPSGMRPVNEPKPKKAERIDQAWNAGRDIAPRRRTNG